MPFVPKTINNQDREIIGNIMEGGRMGMKGEDLLFSKYAYFMAEGRKKFNMCQEDAFDAYSDSVLSVIHSIRRNSFEGKSSLKTYLYQVFHNKCVDHIRKSATNKRQVHQTIELTDLLNNLSDTARSIVQQLVDKTDISLLRRRLQEIGDNCRKMLMMYADGYSDKDIAVHMEYRSADVVKTSRLRCLDKLRQLYQMKS